MKEQMNIVIAGHVDHGKSTVIGRMLADTGSLPQGKLEMVKENCRRNSKPFEYAFLLDALKDEQSQGITIDSARIFFKTRKRDYIIIDAPGHIEFLKNMVSGASHAEAALLVIDAEEGVQENSRRHGYMLSMLGIKQLVVLVNKMDLVDYSEAVYQKIKKEYTAFLNQIDVEPMNFIPVSGREGDNIAGKINAMSWYDGDCLLDVLDQFTKEKPDIEKPFRMPVQDVYKFTKEGDTRRIVAGTIEAGQLSVGDEVIFLPSGKTSSVHSIEVFNAPLPTTASVGQATGFTLTEQIYVTRGEIAVKGGQKPCQVAKRIRVNLFWLGRKPFVKDKGYTLKLGSVKVACKLEKLHKLINASNLEAREEGEMVRRHDVAECTLQLNAAIAFDLPETVSTTSRFVIVDEYEIAGGGIVRDALEDRLSWVRDNVRLRNYKWEKSMLSAEERAEKYSQKSQLILVTGKKHTGRKEVAKGLESVLFNDGKLVYFLGIGNVLYGIDADIKKEEANNREEHLRRLAEVCHIMMDAGMILIVTAIELRQDDLEIIKTTVNPEKIETVWVGDDVTTDIAFDSRVPGLLDVDASVRMLKGRLGEKGVVFRVW